MTKKGVCAATAAAAAATGLWCTPGKLPGLVNESRLTGVVESLDSHSFFSILELVE